MNEHAFAWVFGALVGMVNVTAAAFATRVQVLPDVIDVSIIPTGSGVMSLVLVSYGALRRFEADRIGRLALVGTLFGGVGAAAALLIALVVLS